MREMGHTSTGTGVCQITDSRPFEAKGEESASRQESKAKWGRHAVSFKFSFSVYLFIYFTSSELKVIFILPL